MAAIKQLKIGSTNYDIKALNASNQNQANAVVRDIQYGTANPSGGNSGQIYLQYNTTDTENPYIYAEDTIVPDSNVVDKYYNKNEVDILVQNELNAKMYMRNYSWTGNWSNSGNAAKTLQANGEGLVFINIYVRNSGTDDTGQCDATIYLWNTSNANQGLLASSGNRVSSSSTHQISANAATQWYYNGTDANKRFRCSVSCTKNGTNSWRISATTIGVNCTLTSV